MPPTYHFRISNDLPLPSDRRALTKALLRDVTPLCDGSRLSFLKSGPDPLSFPRRVLRRMKPGDNVFFPAAPTDLAAFRPRLFNAAMLQGIKISTRLSTERDVPGLRVWRTD